MWSTCLVFGWTDSSQSLYWNIVPAVYMGPSKNILNTTPKKMGCFDKMRGRPIFLEAIFGVTHMNIHDKSLFPLFIQNIHQLNGIIFFGTSRKFGQVAVSDKRNFVGRT
jgi:hypothetical protein